MAQFYEDFRGLALGSVPSGFSTPWGSLVLTTITGNVLIDSGVSLEITPVSGLADASFNRAAVEWAAGTTSGRTVVRARMGVTLNTSSTDKWIVGGLVSATGTSSAARGGYAQWSAATNTRIRRYVSGSGTTLSTVTESWAAGELDLTFEVIRDGAQLETRTWLSSGARPAVAIATIIDASPLAVAGFFGLSMLPRDSGSPAVKLYQIAVGTNGDTAPTAPVTTTSGGTASPTLSTTKTAAPSPAITAGASAQPSVASSTQAAYTPTVASGVQSTPTTANTQALATDPAIATGVVIYPPCFTTTAEAYNPQVGAAASVRPSVASTTATSADPVTTAGASVQPTTAQSNVLAFVPSVRTGASTTTAVANTASQSPNPTVVAGIEEYRNKVYLTGVYNREKQLFAHDGRQVTIVGS